ncbi:MAG: ATP-dependent helicase, partial [Chitinophagia bacterium]|nr:ATP-dependent helicase [Chitinophagia bacterium]
MTINEDQFLQRYEKLNERQREAVDTIYGPVMVIAGPGTGKTEVLSMRIANLLRSEAQVQPHEILCLTYTDEATNSMRRRLVQIMGSAAHRVNIYTFHAFCNNVIQTHAEAFSLRALQPISELELTDLLYHILESLPPGHLLRKLSGDLYFDTPRLKKLFHMMKSEYLSPEDVATAIDAYLASLPEREAYVYKRKYKNFNAGDLKQAAIDEETRKMELTRAAALLYPEYDKAMRAAGRYDFADMILWVLDAFKTNDNFYTVFLYYWNDNTACTRDLRTALVIAPTSLVTFDNVCNAIMFPSGGDVYSTLYLNIAMFSTVMPASCDDDSTY